MSEANKQLVRRWFEEVWNQQRESAIDAMFSPEGKSHGFPEEDSVLIGPEDFKSIHRSFRGAFPDVHVTVEDLVAEGDKVAVRWKAEMTHRGDHLGFAATGKRASMNGASFVVVKDGKIDEGWNFMDMGSLFARLREQVA
jgi:steroid delta-isomerase-like uncharacterized protein